MERLKGKAALLTGRSSGFGLETAEQFAAEGARVAITARSLEAFDVARQELGDRALHITSDAGDVSGQKKQPSD